MLQSLKEILTELEWCETSKDIPSIEILKTNGSTSITQHTFLSHNRRFGGILINVSPTHLSTRTPYRTVLMSVNSIKIYGDNYRVTLPLSITEEYYFQASLLYNISEIPLEFLNRCEEVFNKVQQQVYQQN